MSVKLSPIFNSQVVDASGNPATGWKIYTYVAGSSTPLATYTTSTGNVQQSNPIELDTLGFPTVGQIWLTAGSTYKLVLTDENDVVKKTENNVSGVNDTSVSSDEWLDSGVTPTYVSATSFTLVGDQTSAFHVGRRLRSTVTAGTTYSRITASAYGVLTTVTVANDGSQTLDNGLSAVQYGILRNNILSIPFRVATASGTDTYTASVGAVRLVTDDEYKIKIANANASTTPTLNLDGLGAKTIKTQSGAALVPGQLNGQHTFRYDGTDMIVLNPITQLSDNGVNDFRLTLSTGVPVTTTDVAAATTIYCTPYKGNRIDLFDGAGWNRRSSAEFSLALGTLTSTLPYDVFCYDNAGVPTLEFTAWTNTTTRATALAYQDGILSKTGALTRRYLGTFYTISTTQTADSKTVGRFLYNYYNRALRNTQGTFASDRSTTGTSYGELNAEIQNKFILGVSEDAVTGDVAGTASNSAAANQYTATAVAFDSTSTAEAGFETTFGNSGGTANVKMPCGISGSKIGLAVGYHYATLLGKVDGGTGTWNSATSATSAKVYLSLGIMG